VGRGLNRFVLLAYEIAFCVDDSTRQRVPREVPPRLVGLISWTEVVGQGNLGLLVAGSSVSRNENGVIKNWCEKNGLMTP